jgi:hypothetical protein
MTENHHGVVEVLGAAGERCGFACRSSKAFVSGRSHGGASCIQWIKVSSCSSWFSWIEHKFTEMNYLSRREAR